MTRIFALGLLLAGCGCDLGEGLLAPVGRVRVKPSGQCEGPLVEVTTPPELRPPWSGGPSSEFGLIRTLYDGGVLVRQVLLTVRDGTWSTSTLSPRIAIRSISADGTLCGALLDDAGVPSLALEFLDGGVLLVPGVTDSCIATEAGWWTAWSYPNVLRGHGDGGESVGNVDGGVVPGVTPSGTIPSIVGVRADGEVLISVNYARPGAWLLPSLIELKSPAGYSVPIGFAGLRPYGLNAGPVLREPLVWDDRGEPTRLNTGDGSYGYVQTVDLHGHSDGHFCGSIELEGVGNDAVAFWKRDGGFVSPKQFASLDAGIEPIVCAPIGPDWFYVTHLEGEPAIARSALLRLKLDCLNL